MYVQGSCLLSAPARRRLRLLGRLNICYNLLTAPLSQLLLCIAAIVQADRATL